MIISKNAETKYYAYGSVAYDYGNAYLGLAEKLI